MESHKMVPGKTGGDRMNQNRQIDILKGLGIFFVVAGHSGSCLTGFYYTFHMGLMFMISGWLLSGKANEAASVFLRKRIRSVLVPYLVFFGISVMYAELAAARDGGFFPLTVNHLKALLLGGNDFSQYCNNSPLWYLYLYFLASIVYFLLLHLSDGMKFLAAVVLAFITVPFQSWISAKPVFFVNVLPAAVVYMLFGYAVKRLIGERGNFQLGAVLLFAGWYSSEYYGGGMDLAHITSVLYYIESFCTIIGLYLLVFRLKGNRVLEYLGAHSLYILGLHSLIGNLSIKLSDFIAAVFRIENPYLGSLLFTVITIVLSCGAADVFLQIRRFCQERGE